MIPSIGLRRGGLLLCLALTVPACTTLGESGGYGKPRTVRYRVTGSAPSVSVTYQNANGDSSQLADVPVPWALTVSLNGGAFAYVSAQNQGAFGNETCEIWVDDVLKESNSSSGAYTICTASGLV